MIKRLLIILVINLLTHTSYAAADSVLYNKACGFGEFAQASDVTTVDDHLHLDNPTDSLRFSLIHLAEDKSFKSFSVLLRNTHNHEGKSYHYFDSENKKHTIANPIWGIVWNYQNPANYYQLRIHCINTNLYDPFDCRKLIVEVIRRSNGCDSTLYTGEFTGNDLNLNTEYNALVLRQNDRNLSLFIQHNKSLHITTIPCKVIGQVGYFAGPASSVDCKRLSLRFDAQVDLTKHLFDVSKIPNIIKIANEGIVGYWEYLDRNIKNDHIRLGGKYTLAVIPNPEYDGTYDIIYISGAKTNGSRWLSGMIKGHLYPTRFIGNYQLYWIDSEMYPITEQDDDSYATLKDNVILEFNFPLHNSSIRFSKQVSK